MSKYQKGKTSPEIAKKQKAISRSIDIEIEQIKAAIMTKKVPETLSVKNGTITLRVVQQWENSELSIVKYSAGTGLSLVNREKTAYLKSQTSKLNQSLKKANAKQKKTKKKSNNKTKADLNQDIQELKLALEQCQRTVVEIYRTYELWSNNAMKNGEEKSNYIMALRKSSSEVKDKLLKVIK